MTIEQALKKLKSARKREAKATEDKRTLTAWLIARGVDLDGSKARARRDKQIYRLWKKGILPKDIAPSVNITPERIRSICMRMEIREEKAAAKKAESLK